MRKFMINVNGRSYEVEVEEIGGTESTPQTTAAVQAVPSPVPQVAPTAPVVQPTAVPAPVAQPAAAPTPESAPAQSTATAGSVSVNAPMPGNILDVRAKTGESIQKGQVIVILEAMKMENEIMAPQDGKISSINTSKGSTVNSGDLLFTME
ncbi:MAG: acetyl-CoA carboxylase biotin carboxyl carrier protein subunit [Clostridia bacterium]|nr:acetyl-CoA carboxylase biotin carboxyl carrier protein subunit [Clostridia bacterium]